MSPWPIPSTENPFLGRRRSENWTGRRPARGQQTPERLRASARRGWYRIITLSSFPGNFSKPCLKNFCRTLIEKIQLRSRSRLIC